MITLCYNCHQAAHKYSSRDLDLEIQKDLKIIVTMRPVSNKINNEYLRCSKNAEKLIDIFFEKMQDVQTV